MDNIVNLFTSYLLFPALSAIFGVLVGAAEIVARYRDEPFAATFSKPGSYYLALNGVISLAAYFLLLAYKESIFPSLTTDPLMRSIVAGFGSMVVMRSKLFSFKTEGGEDYSVGPDAVISTFLTSIDRKIDRYRASERQKLVYEEIDRININELSKASEFLKSCLASYQNLSDAEKKELSDVIELIEKQTTLDPKLRLMAIGFGFLNISGDTNFKELMKQLKAYMEKGTNPPYSSGSPL